MASHKKGGRQYPRLRWSHRAKRGVFLIGLLLVFVIAALIAMGG